MAIERARVHAVQKPWGVNDLRPWSALSLEGGPIGELWFERGEDSATSALLLKILATTQPLSIQVHPDDGFAHKMGLPNGKTEAWYILSAQPGAKVAVGLTHRISPSRLRAAIEDGSIVDLICWRSVAEGDTVFIPAGTIHTIGPGLVIAEIQQTSDTTFRMFDYGRSRELHVDLSVAAANAGPARAPRKSTQFTAARTALVVDRHLILEQIALPANTTWDFRPKRETWLFVVAGSARIGTIDISRADCVFAEGESVSIDTGVSGLKALLAYPGPALVEELLCDLTAELATRRPTASSRQASTPTPSRS
jgi:mannose-6-phosphate isomerase